MFHSYVLSTALPEGNGASYLDIVVVVDEIGSEVLRQERQKIEEWSFAANTGRYRLGEAEPDILLAICTGYLISIPSCRSRPLTRYAHIKQPK